MWTNANVKLVNKIEIVFEDSVKQTRYSEAVARGKCIAPKWIPPLLIAGFIFVAIGAAFAMGYYISYPRTSNKSLKLYNETCTVLSRECDESRGLYCPYGQCVCELTNSYYNRSSCVCPNLTLVANQACSSYPSYGEACSSPILNCLPNFMCGSANVCTCNPATQFYNGSYCITQYNYNQTCTQTSQCANSSYLQCIANRCACPSAFFWNGSSCSPKLLGWQICNNRTSGPTALPCDNTLSLSCSSNYDCECPSTMYWDINDQTCEIKRLYGDICNDDTYCNETLNLICPTRPGTCNCPVWSNDYTCDCRPTSFYDGYQCIPRKSINGTCPGTYGCDISTILVCFSGLCVCPTPTAWGRMDCDCPTGQTWTGSACAVFG